MKVYPVDINGAQNGPIREIDDYRWEQMKIQFGKKLSWVAVPKKKSKPKFTSEPAFKKKTFKKKENIAEDDLGKKNMPDDLGKSNLPYDLSEDSMIRSKK